MWLVIDWPVNVNTGGNQPPVEKMLDYRFQLGIRQA